MNDKTVQHIKKLYHDGLSIRYIANLMKKKKGIICAVLRFELQQKKQDTKRMIEIYNWLEERTINWAKTGRY